MILRYLMIEIRFEFQNLEETLRLWEEYIGLIFEALVSCMSMHIGYVCLQAGLTEGYGAS